MIIDGGVKYHGSVYRPPSEAYSLIIQSTLGCSHNGCAFCSMYKDKRFSIRSVEAVISDLRTARTYYKRVQRVFFADGDALMRDTNSQLELLHAVYEIFPECERVTCYASPNSIAVKSDGELEKMCSAGLDMLYIGLESGSDEVLTQMNKGCTSAEIIRCTARAKHAGFKISVTAILGLGGERLMEEHAICTADALSAIKADYIGLLSLMLEPGAALYDEYTAGRFKAPMPRDILAELRLMLEHIDSEGSVFRANHASNYVDLRGTLNADCPRMLAEVEAALGGRRGIKPEYFRGL